MKKAMLLFGLIGLSSSAFGYNVVDRLKLLDDQFKTQEMLRPIGHDFFLDVSAAANTNVTDFIDDVESIGDFQGTTTEQIDYGTAKLQPYVGTEQFVRVNAGLGFPIFSFTAFGAKIEPNFRANGGLTMVTAIRDETFTSSSLIETSFPPTISSATKAAFQSCTFAGLSVGDDMIAGGVTEGCITSTQAEEIRTGFRQYYSIPNFSTLPLISTSLIGGSATLPYTDIYLKGEAKAGFFLDINKEHWFGNFGVYDLLRADLRKVATVSEFVSGGDVLELGEDFNTTQYLGTDFKIGYKNSNYSIMATIEELTLGTLSDRKEGTAALLYEDDPLLRLHGEAHFRPWILSLKAFAGAHSRSGYGFGDSYYLGADWGAYVWGDRLGLQLRTMVDNTHFTIAPRLKLWLMQLEYTLRSPLESQVDGVKPSTLHMLNIRFFI